MVLMQMFVADKYEIHEVKWCANIVESFGKK